MNTNNYFWFIYGVSIGIVIGFNFKKKPPNDFEYNWYVKRQILRI